jgi:hypothetical protein
MERLTVELREAPQANIIVDMSPEASNQSKLRYHRTYARSLRLRRIPTLFACSM